MRLAIAAATIALIAAPAAGADAQIEQTVARHVSTIVPADGAGGVAVALRLDGRALFFNYGWADRATKRPITSNTVFNLASLRKVFEATLLAQAVQDGVGLLHRAPPGMARTVARQHHFLPRPLLARRRAPAPQPMRGSLAQLPAPLAAGCVGHGAPTGHQACWPVAIAPGAASGEPDAMTEHGTGQAVVLVTLGVGRRGHGWLPLLGATGHGGAIAGGQYGMAQAGWSAS